MKRVILSFLCAIIGMGHLSFAQIQVINFTPESYRAAGQNWCITEWNNHIYCANHDGLLQYNGNDWTTLTSKEQPDVRAMEIWNNRIYTAGANSLGYWTMSPYSQPEYVSLFTQVQNLGVKDDIVFWSIAHTDDAIYFQSFTHIIGCRNDSCFIVVNQQCFLPLFSIHAQVYTQHLSKGIYTIYDDSIYSASDNDLLRHYDIEFCVADKDSAMLIGLSNGEIYRIVDSMWTFMRSFRTTTGTMQFSCACYIDSVTLVIGTRGSGLFCWNIQSGQINSLEPSKLQDLNVHDVCYNNHMLWAALDNGITAISLQSGQEMFPNAQGVLVSALFYQNEWWLATNRGLYRANNEYKYDLLGLPLYLFSYQNMLFCGTTERLYQLTNQGVQQEFAANGVQQAESVLDMNMEVVFIRSYAGLGLLRSHNTHVTYTFLGQLGNCQQIMPESSRQVWALRGAGYLSRVHISQDMTRIVGVDNYTNSIRPICMVQVDNRVLFVCSDGIYTYRVEDSTFVRSGMVWDNQANVRTVVHKSSNELWVATDDFLYLYRVQDMQSTLLQQYSLCGIPLLQYDNSYMVFPHNDQIVIGTGAGALRVYPESEPNKHWAPWIEKCTYEIKGELHDAAINDKGITLPAKAKNITVYCATGLLPNPAYISYRLNPQSPVWSNWQSMGTISFSTLASGAYQLSLRGAGGNYISDECSIEIEVQPPFYATWFAYLLYAGAFIILFMIILRIVLFHKTRKLKEQIRVDREKQEALLNAEKAKVLAIKVENQETELQNKLRMLTQQQELIDAIKCELDKQEQNGSPAKDGYKRLLKIVQNNGVSQSKVFSLENYFADVQKDFIARIQPMFPDLTQAELRLCCMIRSNLMTKEIAGIFAIEPRSVELKKYRLKKHLGLQPEEDLTAYIMSI